MKETENFTGPVNIGNPGEFTIIELAEKILEMTNSTSKIVNIDEREDDPVRRRPDIAVAKKRLGWKPKITLQGGLRPTIDYFKKVIKR